MRDGCSAIQRIREALAFSCYRSLKQLQQIHAQSFRRGLLPHSQPLSCRILQGYSAFEQSTIAVRVFAQIPCPDLISLTCLMNLHLRHGRPAAAAAIFREILLSGRRPDGFSIVAAVSASARSADLSLLRSLHGMILRQSLDQETVVCNSVVDAYCRSGKICSARKMFDEMPARDEISWSTIINGYMKQEGFLEHACHLFNKMPYRNAIAWTVMITGFVQSRRPVRALEIFCEMNARGCRPSSVTVVGVLSACADAGALETGRSVHALICKMVDDTNSTTIANGLIDMYSKSGSAETAFIVFKRTIERDVYTWTTMISGLSVNGDGSGALQLFTEMQRSKMAPNLVTFVSVLSACAHAGLIQEGLLMFDIMQQCYGFKPQIQHFGCLIDLLGRAGRFTEAMHLISTMEIEPDAVLWRSLLSACLVHKNRGLAEIAANRVVELEPDDDGAHVLLWNIYASDNRWEEAGQIRESMRSRGIKKRRGHSWIEVNFVVHEFLVDDEARLHENEVFSVLEGLEKQLRAHCENYNGFK